VALCATTCGPLPFPPAPPPLLPGVEIAAELRHGLAALGGERIPFGSAGTAGFESVVHLDLVPGEDEDEDRDEDIGAWSGRG
jgi:hypothetical protein